MPVEQLPKRLRPEIEGFEPYSPGLNIEEIQTRYGLATVIKLASNENPLGASPVVQKAIQHHAGSAFRYPRSRNVRLRQALASRLGVDSARVVTGNGSDELIDLLIRVCAVPGRDKILAFRPCFSIYELQSRLCGVDFVQTPLKPDFSFDWEGLLAKADESTALVFATNPDNPTGLTVAACELADIARRLPKTALFVIDEAYIDFADDPGECSLLPRLTEFPNVVILRTFSKAYGLAGLRLGYGVFPSWLADAIWRVRLPFSVNLLAEEAGLAALEDEVFYRETLRVVREGREELTRGLAGLGCQVSPSQSNFLLFSLPQGGPDAREMFERLLRRGIIVRPLASYNLPGHIRVSVGKPEENRAFLQALAEELGA